LAKFFVRGAHAYFGLHNLFPYSTISTIQF
jgi:hypothetical protein